MLRDEFGMNSLKFSYFANIYEYSSYSSVFEVFRIFNAFNIFKLFRSDFIPTSEIYFTIILEDCIRKLSIIRAIDIDSH